MNTMKKMGWVLGLMLPLAVHGQQEKLSLNQAIELAIQQNRTLLKVQEEVKQARADHQSGRAAYLPTVELSSTYTLTNDPLYSFGFKLQQKVVTMADFNPDLLNDPGTSRNFHAGIEVVQPLINPDAWVGKRAAGQKVKATEYKAEFSRDHLIAMVKRSYYGIQLADGRVSVLEKALGATQSYLKLTHDNMAQGYAMEADVLLVRVRVQELDAQIKAAQNQVLNSKEMLNYLLGRDRNVLFQPADSLTVLPIPDMAVVSILSRADLKAMSFGVEAREKITRMEKYRYIPRLNAMGTYGFNHEDLFRFDQSSWMVGIRLQWRIFDGWRDVAAVKKSRSEYNMAKIDLADALQKSEMELDQSKRTVWVAFSQMDAYQTAVQQSEQALKMRTDRYRQGLERTSDLMMAEAQLAESRLKYLNSMYEYNAAIFQYQLLSGIE